LSNCQFDFEFGVTPPSTTSEVNNELVVFTSTPHMPSTSPRENLVKSALDLIDYMVAKGVDEKGEYELMDPLFTTTTPSVTRLSALTTTSPVGIFEKEFKDKLRCKQVILIIFKFNSVVIVCWNVLILFNLGWLIMPVIDLIIF